MRFVQNCAPVNSFTWATFEASLQCFFFSNLSLHCFLIYDKKRNFVLNLKKNGIDYNRIWDFYVIHQACSESAVAPLGVGQFVVSE